MSLLTIGFVLGRKPLVDALGRDRLGEVRRTATREAARAIALLPDLPDHPGAHMFLVATCALVGFHRALPDRDAAANSALFQASLRHAARWLPLPLRRLYRWVFFRPGHYRKLVAGTFGGAGFEGTLEDDPARKTLAVTYTGCGIQLFLERIGASELGPHICGLDELESEVFELGLERTGTLGRGASCCDFVWTHPRGG